MMRSIRGIILTTIVSAVAAGCATIQDPGRTGFLSDYSKLVEVDENHLVYATDDLGNYSKFIIDPIAMLYRNPEDDQIFSDAELEELQEHFATKVREALTEDDGYSVVDAEGPGTVRLRIAITGVDDTIGALNITIYTKVTGAGLGGASMEGEIVDSVTGEQIAAVIRWGSGSRVLVAGLTHTGDAKIVINRWAKDLRERIDEAHGR
ncbi:MAG: DUF3313 domain-containing protein [Gammaproteobacteria bacterium]